MKATNAMCRQAWSIPELIRQQYPKLEAKTRKLLRTEEIFSLQRIILTGCGDSYAAALSMQHVFELLTGIPTEVVPALTLARYYHPNQIGTSPNNPMVVVISNSGAVARLGEAVQFVNAHDGFTVGITSNPDSVVGKNVRRILKLDIPPFESSPGVRSYLVSVLSLYLMAVRIGEVRGNYTMDQAEEYRRDCLNQADALERMLPDMDASVRKIAETWKDFACFDFVGGGFDYAAAFYGHAKILEATGRYAMRINTEEWLHLNFFARNYSGIGTVMIANTTNPGLSRMKECLHYAEKLKRPLLIITDGDKEALGAEGTYIQVPSTQSQITMPLTQFVPTALLAGYLAEFIGETYGRGAEGPWEFAKDGSGVQNSEIVVRKNVLK